MKIPYMSLLKSIVTRGALLVLIGCGVAALAGDASAQQTQAAFSQGHAICGGLDLRTGRLLDVCGFEKATYTSKAVGKCPSGSFFDIGTWSCFTCPRGYNRTAFAVDTPAACSKRINAEYKYAKRVGGQKSCPKGTFKDLRNGGECWQCPEGFGRTMSAVTSWDACGKAFESARKAEFIDRTCTEGAFPDPNGGCYTCPEGYRRTAAPVTAHNACFRDESLKPAQKETALTCKEGEIFDFIDGGTCWKCPENSVRSVFGVKTDKACEFTNIRWEAAKRTPNGLFALPGGHEIAAQLIKEGTRIDKAITAFIEEDKQNQTQAEADEFKVKAWELIRTEPESSPILMAAVYDQVFDLIKGGAKTKPERDLLNYLAVYVQQSRRLSASEMSDIWQSWTRGQQARTSALATRSMHSAYDVGIAPPDIKGLIGEVMHLAPGGAMIVSFVGTFAAQKTSSAIANLTAGVARTIRPYKWAQAIATIKNTTQVGTNAAAASAGAGVFAFAGPLVILTATSIIASIATENAIEQNKQEAIVKDALLTAQKPVNLARLVLTEEGRTEVLSNWALMTQEPIAPKKQIWAKLMPQTTQTGTGVNVPTTILVGDKVIVEAANGAPQWEKVDGAARDVAIGSDGTAYAIGVKKIGGDYQIFKRAKTASRWTRLSGSATRIAVHGTQAWVVNSKGAVYAASGNGWQQISAPSAQDIGASAKSVWIVGTDGKIYQRQGNGWQNVPGTAQRIDIDQDGRPWAVNARGDIYAHDNNKKWQKLPGQAVDIAVDVPGLARLAAKNGKVYSFNSAKRDWDPISQDSDTLAIGAGAGQVWRLTKGNAIYRLK